NQCGGTNYGDGKVRGYITIDSTRACTTLFPGDAGYFLAGGTGIATDDNVLWGDYSFYDRASNFAYSDNLVHIEASAIDPLTTTPGKYTFYGRRESGSAIDNREA